MKEIELSQGKVALVDDEDFEELSRYKWHAYKQKDTFYARRHIYISHGHTRLIRMHQQIMGTPEGLDTHHVDHDGLNNQKYNLRICTRSQNRANTARRAGAGSKYKGVYLTVQRGKYKYWGARITANGKRFFLGYYKTEDEAALAYNQRATTLFGEFAFLNHIGE